MREFIRAMLHATFPITATKGIIQDKQNAAKTRYSKVGRSKILTDHSVPDTTTFPTILQKTVSVVCGKR